MAGQIGRHFLIYFIRQSGHWLCRHKVIALTVDESDQICINMLQFVN